MPPVAAIPLLPAELRAWLDRELTGTGFGRIRELTEALNAKLAEQGLSLTLGKSTVGKYSHHLKRKIATIQASTEAAKAIAAAAPDEADERAGAVNSLIQSEIFEALLLLTEAEEGAPPEDRLEMLGKAARAAADLTRASVAQKKWAAALRAKAAVAVETEAKTQGVSAEGIAALRAAIMGAL